MPNFTRHLGKKTVEKKEHTTLEMTTQSPMKGRAARFFPFLQNKLRII